MSFRILKNNENPDWIDRLLRELPPAGTHGLKKNEDYSYVEEEGLYFVVESDEPDFCRWAGVRLGYFELAG